MATLYVTSLERGAGKTTLCAGLGKHLRANAKKVGFFKPGITDNKRPIEPTESDAIFMKQILALEEPIDSLCPVISSKGDLASKIKEAYAKVSPGKDIVIVEDVGEQSQASYRVAEALDARIIIVESYSSKLSETDSISSYKDFGERLLGVVFNKVPKRQVEHVHTEMTTRLGEAGINILGVLPEDRLLYTLTVGELAGHLQGEILNCTEKSVELVENFMLGAMGVDPGPEYFKRKTNKAAVVKGERPDMQLAALETSTRCLILSGNTAPIPTVLYRAEEKEVPIILARGDTIATVVGIEDALGKTRFNQEKKLPRLSEVMEKNFNFQAVYNGLGLTG